MSDTHKAIEAVWKIESTRLIAGMARVTRDIGIAEELAQDALVAALERWPEEGIPEKPAAWLMTAAKRRAIDSLRPHLMFFYSGTDLASWGANLPGSPVIGVSDSVEHLTQFVVVVQRWSDGTEYREGPAAEHHH